ncbi:MAG TPA: NADH:flavin oxidoreductase [Caldilineaceae bacterium]|nr:NADH:flavin oxidoreductase [Caldilineaceae bacterium]
MKIRRVATLRTPDDVRSHAVALGIDLPLDDEVACGPDAPLAQPLRYRGRTIGNRFAVLPMEGWDGTTDGRPTDLVRRRWANFGKSGAKLIWGGEAVAVRPDGRANPNQLVIGPKTVGDLAALREHLVSTHEAHFGRSDDLLVGLQLTHSGRFARPVDKKRMAPQILYHHPLLDARFGLDPSYPLLTDEAIAALIEDFVAAAALAQQAGFDFVDIKHCHGYLGHEFLSAFDREGRYGGSFENRTRFLREITAGIRAAAPGLDIGVRLSAFDFVPFQPAPDEERVGVPSTEGCYRYAFGGDGTGVGIDLTEPLAFLDVLAALDIRLVCITGGSPYYNPHIQRPALFPPSDGYQPPEDPLVGVARQLGVAAALKTARPQMVLIGSGYSYLQDWLPNVAQAVVRTGGADFVGLGRMMLAYPELPADVLAGRPLARKRLCRTFSDCTTGPRNGLISGCYPLDPFYKARPEHEQLAAIKKALGATS